MSEVQEEQIDLSEFIYHDKIEQNKWLAMLTHFESYPYCKYHQVDRIALLPGYSVFKLKDHSWYLEQVNIDLRKGLYHFKGESLENKKDLNSIIENSFIFCLNGNIYQYKNKKSGEEIKEMAKEVWFELTRLTIVDKMANEIFVSKKYLVASPT